MGYNFNQEENQIIREKGLLFSCDSSSISYSVGMSVSLSATSFIIFLCCRQRIYISYIDVSVMYVVVNNVKRV